jgi:undecaprenyl-diphosphatase
MRILLAFYETDCRVFQRINRHFDNKILNVFFRYITHLGGAKLTISAVLLLILLSSGSIQQTAIANALSLTVSHLPVQIIKKMYPRKRPYVRLENTHFLSNPLQDHSFPSGHTTAVFSIIIPFVLLMPVISIILLPLAFFVGLSRIYLGLHFPTDVIGGSVLGTLSGISSYLLFVH